VNDYMAVMQPKLSLGVVLGNAGGYCPVQADGRIDSYPFYFRSRGSHWSLKILMDKNAEADYCGWPEDADIWEHREKYSEEEFAAGWIEPEESAEFINKATDLFRYHCGEMSK
jgi:hypothetical protein